MKTFQYMIMALGIVTGAAVAGDVAAVDVGTHGAKPDGSDSTPGVMAALKEVRRGRGNSIVFQSGDYHFWPDQAEERYLFVSNNDEGLKRIAIPLVGLQDISIQGNGARFIFHGPMIPILVEDSHKVSLSGFSIDFVRPFHSEGKVHAITSESVDLEFAPEFPYEIRNGILVFTDGPGSKTMETTVTNGDVTYPYTSLLAFDPVKREPAFMASDRYSVGDGIVAREIAPRNVRITLDKVSANPGDVLVFGAPRKYPGIVISDSSSVGLDSINIHHCGGMGVIAQRSSDLTLLKIHVTPPPGGKRVVSVTADATHFVNCRGRIEMSDCVFEQQKDDATNIHGLYARIQRVIGNNRLELRMVHPQQAGVDFVKVGTRIEFTHGPSLAPLGFGTAKSVQRINRQTTLVETADPLPETLKAGDAVADADANTAEVLIRNCVFRNNRARGILLGSRGRTVIEGNIFHSPGAAILFEGDASFWFEQAGVRDVSIRGNTFDNCNFGVWGRACIQVGSGISEPFRKTSRYNRGITIENNLFKVFSPLPLLSMYSVDGLVFRNNHLEETNDYPREAGAVRANFVVVDCDNTLLEDPRSKGTGAPEAASP